MSNPTPGPWKVCHDGFVKCSQTGERVCSPHSTLPDQKKNAEHRKNWEANARLIAAAPDLLEALKDMCAEFRALDLPYGSEAYAAATRAINKAAPFSG